MFKSKSKLFFAIILLLFLNIVSSVAQTITKVEVIGNDRISDDTIIMFSKIDKNKNIDVYDLNQIIKSLYDTNYFNNISVSKKDTTLIIKVEENPIIGQINFEGIKAKKIIKAIKDKHKLKSRTSYNSFLLEEDKKQTSNILKNLGYYFPVIEISINEKENNIIDINYDIDIGKKAKIRKISFTGDKIFKDGKLKSIIISEEYKPWKFISGKKYLNENFISLDNRLLKNFYLNKGFYNVKINSSFAKIINDNEFELIFNINANKRYFFDNLDLELPIDFRNENYKEIYRLFNDINLLNKSKILMTIQLLHKKLIKKKLTISVAESCTGGLLAHNLTKLANSSKYFQMGLTTYSNQAKMKILKVNKNIIDKYGAVSKECCKSMVQNLSNISKSKINVSITGIAGPGGGTKDKPVGLVYIGIKKGKTLLIKENRFKSKKRNLIQTLTVKEVIKTMLKLI